MDNKTIISLMDGLGEIEARTKALRKLELELESVQRASDEANTISVAIGDIYDALEKHLERFKIYLRYGLADKVEEPSNIRKIG